MLRQRQNTAATRGEKTIAVLDVGTSKVAAMIALHTAEGALRVLGTGLWECQGLKRGLVTDVGLTENAIRTAMGQAERNAETQIKSALVSISAGGLGSEVVSVEADIAGQMIKKGDIDHVLAEGRARISPGTRRVLHARPALYTIDGMTGVTNPIDIYANRLGVDIHVITADPPPILNLDLCVRTAEIAVERIIAAPVAASIACLADEERDLGVALVEIGAGITNVAVHLRGQLVGLASIPMGSGDITDDIASYFATTRKHAERLKTFLGSANSSPRDNHDMVEIVPIMDADGIEPVRVPRAALLSVIRARLDLLFGEIDAALAHIGFKGPHGRQVVLTGGGAELKGIADYAQGHLGRQVRIGRPHGLIGLPDAQSGCAFTTLAGLVRYGAQPHEDITTSQPSRATTGASGPRTSVWGELFKVLKGGL